MRFVKWCLFVDRLAPYFNGENHVERIRYHENVSREAIENIVHLFASVRKKNTYHPSTIARIMWFRLDYIFWGRA